MVLTTALLVGLAGAPTWAQTPTTPDPTPAPTAPTEPKERPKHPKAYVDAWAQATKTGAKVEVPSENTETATVWAKPDGKTFEMIMHSEPVRMKNPKGGFIPIDTTLVNQGGAIKPKAAKGGLTLSAGKNTTLLTSTSDKGTIRLDAPATLPAPQLSGNRATYPSAYGEGIDLVVHATATGFRQQVVIRTRPGGPVTVRVPAASPKGMALVKDGTGAPAVRASKDAKPAKLPPPRLIDAKAATPGAGTTGTAGFTLDGNTLVYTPDAAYLANPATTYPVTLDAATEEWWIPEVVTDTYVADGLINGAGRYARDQANLPYINVGQHDGEMYLAYIRFPDIPADSSLRGGKVFNADLILSNFRSSACGMQVGSGITAHRITEDWDVATLAYDITTRPSFTEAGANTELGAYSSDINCPAGDPFKKEEDLYHYVNDIAQAWADGEPNYGFFLAPGKGGEDHARNWRMYRSSESTVGAHGPQLKVGYEPAPPPRQETVVLTSRDPLVEIPEYEEALTRSVYRPETPDTIESLAMSEELVDANEQLRDGAGTMIGSEEIPHPAPDEGGEDTGGDEDGEFRAPRVLSTEPAPEAVNIPLNSRIRVTFSEPVGGTRMTVKNAQGAELQGTLESDSIGKTVTFTPAQHLLLGTKYTVEVSEAIDGWDNVMDPYTWSFTTLQQAAGHWTFDEGKDGTAADSSGNGLTAKLNRTASWIPGKAGSAISNTPSQVETAALQRARTLGKPVEVPDLTTETSQTFANPDGKTFTTQISSGPVRVRQGNTWVPVDPTLVEQGGVLRPKAAKATMAFSPGGQTPMATMDRDGKTFTLRWPSALPRPEVKDNVATYKDAAGPGADLVVTALGTGFRHDVVLRSKPAKPLEIRLPVETRGLTFGMSKQGGLQLTGAKGKVEASAPKPVMWDADSAQPKPGTAEDSAKLSTKVVTEGGQQVLVLTPDAEFLADPATKYPVTIDPTTTLALEGDIDVAKSQDGYPGSVYLSAGGGWGTTTRAYIRFGTEALAGASVSDAKLELWNFESSNCPENAPGIQVRRVTSPWSGSEPLNWDKQPTSTTEDAVTNTKAFSQTKCASTGAGTMAWTVTGIAQDWARGAASHGLVLSAAIEGGVSGNWRYFNSGEGGTANNGHPPRLTVTYTAPVTNPVIDRLRITPATVTDGITVASSLTPALAATLTSPSGGIVRGEFEVEHDPAATGQGTGQIWAGAVDNVTSGGDASMTVPGGKLQDGWKVRWRARAVQGTAASAWSAWQAATIDPPNPTIGQLQVIPSEPKDGKTVTTSLTPSLRATVTDPAGQPLRAEFEIEHDPAATGQGTGRIWAGAADNVGSATQAAVTVPEGLLKDTWAVRWRARAVNSATTLGSPWTEWQSLAVDLPDPEPNPGIGALQITPSSQAEGKTLVTSLTPNLLAQVTNPAGQPLRAEFEIEHDPAAPEGQGTGQVWTWGVDNVPAGTQASVAVPAGTLKDGWQLRWRARAVAGQAASAWADWQPVTIALPKPAVGALTMTPSAVTDGVTTTHVLTPALAATVTHPQGQPVRAEFEIEHDPAAPDGQGTGQIWTGAVDNVPSGSPAKATIPAGKLTDGWKIRWRARAVAGETASPWADWQNVTIHVIAPGSEPLAVTDKPVIRTDQSFTAAAWLRWADKDGTYTVLEQKGTHQAPFRLGNDPEHGLVFTLTNGDTPAATSEGVLSGVEPPVGEWFHLAGVYDAEAKTASLYLNGTLVKTAPVGFTAWNAATPLWLGSTMKGDLDEAQVYQRPLDSGQIPALLLASPGGASASSIRADTPASRIASTRAAAADDFDYKHPSLEKCAVSPSETGLAEYDARISEKPFSSCWSAYLYLQDYEEDDLTKKMKKSTCKNPKKGSQQYLCKQPLPQSEDVSYALRFRATWSIQGYMGDQTGNAALGDGSLKPTDMKFYIKLDDLAVVDGKGDKVLAGSQLSGVPVEIELFAGTTPFSDGDCEPGVRTKTKDISVWGGGKHFELFYVHATPDAGRSFICTIAPRVRFYFDKLTLDSIVDIRLWSDKALDDNGRTVGIRRHGKGEPHLRSWVPNFRCDRTTFGGGEFARIGGCINKRAKRVFVMSKKRHSAFIEVIQHIEDALKPNNSQSFPPLRPGHDWSKPGYPPTRNVLGNEQNKLIYGDWGAIQNGSPGDDERGKPLKRGTPGVTNPLNRSHFSGIELHMDMGTPQQMEWLFAGNPPRHKWSINLCKYYMPEAYPPP
ncbi:DNRLRE domain-containing protein, partial [Bailinhaonella thermotolerans]|uniref:DNRLRE domain-containing protein n=1 Tax=Bailinhaonella thermotolerans TaxID=1070861 RepID=UPI00192A5758